MLLLLLFKTIKAEDSTSSSNDFKAKAESFKLIIFCCWGERRA